MKTNTSYVYLLVASYFSGKKCHNIKYLKYKCIYTNTNIYIFQFYITIINSQRHLGIKTTVLEQSLLDKQFQIVLGHFFVCFFFSGGGTSLAYFMLCWGVYLPAKTMYKNAKHLLFSGTTGSCNQQKIHFKAI